MSTVSDNNKAQALSAKNKGNDLYKQRKFDEALACYDQAIELDPTDITFLNNKSAVYFEQGNYDEAIKQCEKAIEIGRENRADFKLIAKAYARMASCYQRKEQYEDARTFFQKSLTEHRTPETLSKLSDVEKIIKEKERKAYIDPDKSLEEKKLGNEMFQKGDYPAAIKHYTEAIKRNPDDAKLFSNRAACYQKLTEFNLALKDCEECIRLEPTFVKGYIRKGYALLAAKEHAKAQAAFQKALEIDENNKEAIEGYRKCCMSSSPEDIRKRAMADPEIQKILADPAMQMILQQMQNDPKALHEHLKDPEISSKIFKLMESGIISVR
ncbi:stress-induced phosphoprotein 1 [Dermatophagoides farinae]|uniref:Stress-induced-phosphoprotein 1 n=1 Tax=Dermatophagoides farinae TaxID=6954 RepID=A0A922IAV1_DERFA|nr:stress-induced-phosphoprotein 1-like [Dermatophagoides farinae]KAH7636532.1 stress-induced-phosphoprotein 1-like protein [Dermatophagoides farinae]KAH9528607.1 Stress-induced-phosphoprotein 1 [Dermatophagoides farinae]